MTDIVERLRKWSVFGYGVEASADMREAADEITTLRAEVETVGAMHRDACKLAKHRMQEIERLRADLAHADAKGQENDKLLWGTIKANERLRAALEPFANALKGNWSAQSGSMKIVAGPHAHDLRLELTLYDFRRAALAQEKPHDL
jgi:recombinational DNA repair ATPase RecF